MTRLKKYRKQMQDDTLLLEPSFLDTAVVGVVRGKMVYAYPLLVEAYAKNNGGDEQTWREFVDYNTLGALPYMGSMAPIVVDYAYDPEDHNGDEILKMNDETWIVVGGSLWEENNDV